MRKWMGFCMVLCMAAAFTGCGSSDTQGTKQEVTEGANDTSKESSISDCITLLKTTWDAVPEGERFPVAGGDFAPENQVMDGPGKFGLTDTEALDSTLGLPATEIGGIEEAASLMHMMNANTFTCGAFQLKSGTDADGVVDKIKNNLLNRQWMCGMPDKVVISTNGEYIVVMFGENDLVDMVQGKMEGAYSEMKVVVDEPIAGK